MFTPSSQAPTLRVGIYRSTSIGDVVLATACLNLLERLDMPTEVIWLGRQPALQLIGAAYPRVKCLEVRQTSDSQGYLSLARELGDLHFVIDLQTNLRSRFVCRSLRRDYKIPYYTCEKNSFGRGRMVLSSRLRGRSKPLPEKLQESVTRQFETMADCLRRALEKHLPVEMRDSISGYRPVPRLPTEHDEGQRPWQKELKFGRWLAIAPGAAHPPKQAPLELIQQVLEHLRTQIEEQQKGAPGEGVGLLFLGNERDRDLAINIMDQVRWPYSVLNLAGKLSLWESALAVKEVAGILTNDSALSHIAEAVGVPSVALFGPTVEAFGFAPWRSDSRSFSVDLGCRPCSKHGKVPCRYGDYRCFTTIDPRAVAHHMWDLVLKKMRGSA